MGRPDSNDEYVFTAIDFKAALVLGNAVAPDHKCLPKLMPAEEEPEAEAQDQKYKNTETTKRQTCKIGECENTVVRKHINEYMCRFQ